MTACLARLPGVGRRSAERMAFRLVGDSGGLLADLAAALERAGQELRWCSKCGSVTSRDMDPCLLCTDPSKDDTQLCVVEEPGDIMIIERSGAYNGRYHALAGKISPMRNVEPGDLRIRRLLDRVKKEGFREIILALNTDVESDATAEFIAELLKPTGVRVARPAYGLPVGSGITYADPETLSRAVRGRRDV